MNGHGQGLGDRVPPMMVKELRQGLNSGMFVVLFLSFQGAMCIIHVAAFAGSAEAVSVCSYGLHAILLLAVFPVAAVLRIRSELRGNKFELVVLSGLEEKGLVYGVFFAMYAQTVLFIISGVPYWVLRHYVGGVDLVEDLLRLGTLLMVATIPLGIATGLSAYRWYENLIGGIFFGLILVPGGGTFLGIVAAALNGLGTPWPVTALVLYAMFGIPTILIFLALGAVRIRERMITLEIYAGPVAAR